MADASGPRVSVIVPVRNDADGCRHVVAQLARQSLAADRFEIVIGDDGSRPGDLDGIETGDGRVRVVSGPPRTSYAARNRAVAASRGEVLAFCDSDCRPDPDWLSRGLAALDHADLVAGEVVFVGPARPSVWTLLTVDSFLDQARNVRRSRGVTANLFIRRADFDRWGGFDAALVSGGDFDFVGRAVHLGARLVYAADAIVRHPTIDAATPFLRKIWRTNFWSALRRRRTGTPISWSTVVGCVPLAGAVVVRRGTLRSAGKLDRSRLGAAGIDVTRAAEVGALATYYVVVSQVANVARLAGWFTAARRSMPPGAAADRVPRSGSSASAP